MAKDTHITKMTFYHYVIDIYYQSYENGAYGFRYNLKEGDEMLHMTLPVYKTALEAGHAALDELQEMHNEKD